MVKKQKKVKQFQLQGVVLLTLMQMKPALILVHYSIKSASIYNTDQYKMISLEMNVFGIFFKYRKKCCKYFLSFYQFYHCSCIDYNVCLKFFSCLDYKGYLLHIFTFQSKCKDSEYYEQHIGRTSCTTIVTACNETLYMNLMIRQTSKSRIRSVPI